MKHDPLTLALYAGALTHFGVLIASSLAPGALNWRENLAVLPPLLRQMFWVYGAFIVLIIVSFGTVTAVFAPTLATGDPLARAFCGMVAVFWAARLIVQFFVFDAKPFLTRWLYKIGYQILTIVFIALVAIYTWGAFA